MVRRGIDNWEGHKEDVRAELLKRKLFSPANVDIFMDYYAKKYEPFGRNLIDFRLAWALMDDYFYVKNNGTKWYAIVGIGGTGKTTLTKNLMYFQDSSFRQTPRMAFDYQKFTSHLQSMQKMNGVFLDEPDDDVHPMSAAGRKLRSLCGKARFQHFFIGICATDLSDIPSFIYKKLSGIIFLPYKGKGYFFKDSPEKGIYIIQRIKKEYKDEGYGVFMKLAKHEENCIEFYTHNMSPLSAEQEVKYIDEKTSDYDRTIKELDESLKKNGKSLPDVKTIERDLIIKRMNDAGYTKEEVGYVIGVTTPYVKQLRRELRQRGVELGGHSNTNMGHSNPDEPLEGS